MKKLFIGLTLLTSILSTAFAEIPNLELTIEAHDGLYVKAQATYFSNSNSSDCTTSGFDDGGGWTVTPDRISVKIPSRDGKPIIIPNKLNNCDATLMKVSLYVEFPDRGPANFHHRVPLINCRQPVLYI